MNNDFHDIVWVHGIKHSVYVDNSNNGDFSVETVVRQNQDGTVTILSCNLIPHIKKRIPTKRDKCLYRQNDLLQKKKEKIFYFCLMRHRQGEYSYRLKQETH